MPTALTATQNKFGEFLPPTWKQILLLLKQFLVMIFLAQNFLLYPSSQEKNSLRCALIKCCFVSTTCYSSGHVLALLFWWSEVKIDLETWLISHKKFPENVLNITLLDLTKIFSMQRPLKQNDSIGQRARGLKCETQAQKWNSGFYNRNFSQNFKRMWYIKWK